MEELTVGEQFVVDWQRGYLGSFKESLARTIMAADINNTQKLEQGFPDEVGAMSKYMNLEGWWQELEAKVYQHNL